MVRFVHKEQPEITMDYVNMPEESARRDALKRCSGEDGGVTAAAPDSPYKTRDIEVCKNLIEESDKLKEKLINFNYLFQQGWVYFHPSFYYISSTKKSWNDSREDCLQRGADLMVINSKEEQFFSVNKDFTRKFNKLMWIGLTDRETKGMWIWVDGTPLDKSYWTPGEPNAYEDKNEDCVELKSHDIENSWNDIPCEDENFWICEK
ncbi:CD209 antigen-like protein E isoform X3 [Dicentrarchus labrax]|uniref:CD209 antigen-like protein E isoform X3 n=1 Tax=Dicentrarchus labrax TaxID=13489 RepID=UPI0021F58EE1|nr:CD209 antigen-like protein E isoform X3 [Dicentrarchus labrax]